jgi:hypothetical protein
MYLYSKDGYIVLNYLMDMTMALIIWLENHECS